MPKTYKNLKQLYVTLSKSIESAAVKESEYSEEVLKEKIEDTVYSPDKPNNYAAGDFADSVNS